MLWLPLEDLENIIGALKCQITTQTSGASGPRGPRGSGAFSAGATKNGTRGVGGWG